MNRLAHTRAYLCGAMDLAADGGVGWREYIKTQLADLKILWLDPCIKPTAMASENHETRRHLNCAKQKGNYRPSETLVFL